jgi:hypothetical protein
MYEKTERGNQEWTIKKHREQKYEQHGPIKQPGMNQDAHKG